MLMCVHMYILHDINKESKNTFMRYADFQFVVILCFIRSLTAFIFNRNNYNAYLLAPTYFELMFK